MADTERRVNLPENPFGTKLYDALADSETASAEVMKYIGAGLGRINRQMQDGGPADSYTLETDDEVDTAYVLTKDGDDAGVQELEADAANAAIEVYNSMFDADVTALFEESPHHRHFVNTYNAYSDHQARIR